MIYDNDLAHSHARLHIMEFKILMMVSHNFLTLLPSKTNDIGSYSKRSKLHSHMTRHAGKLDVPR